MAKKRDAVVRLEAILDALDALGEDALDDLNAELEDAIMLLSETDPDAEPEDYADTLEAIRALAEEYRAMGIGGIDTLIQQLLEIVEKE